MGRKLTFGLNLYQVEKIKLSLEANKEIVVDERAYNKTFKLSLRKQGNKLILSLMTPKFASISFEVPRGVSIGEYFEFMNKTLTLREFRFKDLFDEDEYYGYNDYKLIYFRNEVAKMMGIENNTSISRCA